VNYELTEQLLDKAVEYAKQHGHKMAIAVTDDGGILVGFRRMDGCFKGSVEIAIKKAKTCALFPLPSGAFGELIQHQDLIGMEQTNGGLCVFHGGLPIFNDGTLIGAIGVSGGSAEEDLAVAEFTVTHSDSG
jgi:uncharacterized protein GlcG (DUF336 family)